MGPRVHFFIICATIWFFLSEISLLIFITYTSTDLYCHTLLTQGPSPKAPFFQSQTNMHINPTIHAPTGFFHKWYSNAVITFKINLYPQQFHHKLILDDQDTGFDLLFWNVVVKMYPFRTLCWVNKDENIWSNKFSQLIGQYISNSYWNQISCLELAFLRPNQHLFGRIQQY